MLRPRQAKHSTEADSSNNVAPKIRNFKPVTPSEVARASWDSLPTVPTPDGGQDAILEPLKPKRGGTSAVRGAS